MGDDMSMTWRPQRRVASPRTRARVLSWGAALVACAAALAATSTAATSNVVVTMTVPSATSLDATTCPAAARSFGTVLPDTSVTTSAPCTITFGSSNDSSMLKLYQVDESGDAMFARTDGTAMDTAFGPGGMRSITFPEGTSEAKFGALQADGQYVVGGRVQSGGDWDSALARIGATGTPDALFGDGASGRKVHDFAPTYDELLVDGYVEPGGKIVAVGKRADAGLNFDNAMLVRFTATGQFDPTFGGGDGMIATDAAGWDEWWGVVPARGGGYVTVGCSCDIGPSKALVGRFESDGSPSSFGTNGAVEYTWGTTMSRIQTIVALPSGKYLVGGTRDNGAGERAFVARLNADLTLDTGWAAAGFRDFPTMTGIGRMSLAGPDGSVWVPGHVDNSGGGAGYDILVTRVTAAGAIDTSWNTTGYAQGSYAGASNDWGYGSLALGADQVLVVGGSTGGTGDFHATAFTNGGTAGLDATFSGDGRSTADPSGGWDYAVEAFWGREGRIVSVGTAGTNMGISVFAGGPTIPDYGGGAVFGSANTQAAFGGCLEARSGAGVTGGWTLDGGGSCTAVVGDPWTAIADTSASPTAKVLGSPTVGLETASATLRFGVKTAVAQTPRTYLAPIAIEVVAPNA